VANSYFINNSVSASNVYDTNSGGTYLINTSGTSYFMGLTSAIRLRAPFSGNSPDWNFNYTIPTNHPGLWHGWASDYPKFTLDPNLPHLPAGSYESKAINISNSLKRCTSIDFNFNQPYGSDVNIQIQVADNNINWWTDSNWIGPDGTSATYYTSAGTKSIPLGKGDGNWIRWKAILTATPGGATPSLRTVDLNCIPIGEMVLVANANSITWRGIIYNALLGGANGTLNWFYKIGSGSWDIIDNNSFPSFTTGSPLYIKAKMTGTGDSNGPIMDNNILVSYQPN
jgi:hypothetical protein